MCLQRMQGVGVRMGRGLWDVDVEVDECGGGGWRG